MQTHFTNLAVLLRKKNMFIALPSEEQKFAQQLVVVMNQIYEFIIKKGCWNANNKGILNLVS